MSFNPLLVESYYEEYRLNYRPLPNTRDMEAYRSRALERALARIVMEGRDPLGIVSRPVAIKTDCTVRVVAMRNSEYRIVHDIRLATARYLGLPANQSMVGGYVASEVVRITGGVRISGFAYDFNSDAVWIGKITVETTQAMPMDHASIRERAEAEINKLIPF